MIDLQNITAGLVGLLSFIIVLFCGKFLWRRSKMPPGPFPLPFLGNFLQLHSQGLLPALIKMSNEYGSVFTVYIGSTRTVIVTGYQALKEVFIDHGDDFLDRGYLPLIERVLQPKAISLTNGDTWKQLRQFSLQTLKDFGMGKKSLEEPILEEAHHLVEYFRNLNGQPIVPSTVLSCATANTLANLMIGTRYDYNDEKWMKILRDFREGFKIISSVWGELCDVFPTIMKYLPGPHQKILTYVQSLKDVVKESIRNHQETLDPACPRDYIDCFLIRMKQEESNHSETPFTLSYLEPSLFDMLVGGIESTATTLNFGYLILVKYPELQDKLREEIDCVIGQGREPRAEDRSQMPYMNAIIHEIQRFSDVIPMGFARATTKDITFHGYYIPKGTNVLPMLTTALRDPRQFETPEEFNFKHFLDENGKFKKNNAFIPFAAGKRVCIAESLVRIQLFLFFTIVLQNFTLKSLVDPKDFDISPAENSITAIAPNQKIIFVPRMMEGGA